MEHQVVKEALIAIKESNKREPGSGICSHLQQEIYDHYTGSAVARSVWRFGQDFIYNIVEEWEHFSGCSTFPVPPYRGFKAVDPDDLDEVDHQAEVAYVDCVDMWDKETEYGLLRFKLLDFLIEKIDTYEENNYA